MNQRGNATIAIVLCLFGVIIAVLFFMLVVPIWGVWEQKLAGEAELKRAESNRRILIQEAIAKEEASKLLALAEINRADGVSKANKIIGESLRGHEEYLRYLWITQLEKSQHETIYVPTEANIPILEATRRK